MMQFLRNNGVSLAYQDSATGLPPILFVHGCGFDHASFTQQTDYFIHSHRVVAVDLRGHGMSDAPQQEYTMTAFADDLAWLCGELGLIKPIMVGHSMGGNVVLELAAQCPDLPGGLVLIDSAVLPPPPLLEALGSLAASLQGAGYLNAYRQVLSSLRLP